MTSVKDMKCGFCRIKGHTSRSCEEKKNKLANDIIMEKRKDRAKAKKYSYQEHKEVKPLLDILTEDGRENCINGKQMRSAHFKVPVKPETAACEYVIEPFFEHLGKWRGEKLNISREPTFDTVQRRKRHLDYLIKIDDEKWLVEAEAPNKTHIGMQQVEDFLHSVPNVNNYNYLVTDGFHYHICKPNSDLIDWEHYTIHNKKKIMKNILGHHLGWKSTMVLLFTSMTFIYFGLVMLKAWLQ